MKNTLFIILIMLSHTVMASQYPIIKTLSAEYTSTGATYRITQGLVDIGSAGDTVPGYSIHVALVHKHHMDNGDWVGTINDDFDVAGDSKKTVSELALDVYKREGYVTTISHSGQNGFPECVAYAAGPRYSGYAALDWDRITLPGGCMMVPPANDWCKITTPEILLDHGTMTLKDAEGSSATSSVGVQCTTPTAVTFNLVTNDTYVYLDEGKSEISVDNKPLNTKIDLEQGDSQLAIKDKLTGINSEGAHTGSSVLVMMPY